MLLSDGFKTALEKNGIEAHYDEPMHRHTSFQIGGNADCLVLPNGAEQIKAVLELCRAEQVDCFVMGNGTNLLVSDAGYRGVILMCGKNMSEFTVEGDTLHVGAGVLLSRAAQAAAKASLSGMEALSGIFGTVGGAVCMNAGAYGTEIKDVVSSVTYLTVGDGAVHTVCGADCKFGYRTSLFSDGKRIVLAADFTLTRGDTQEICARMADFAKRRSDKQPLNLPSCGSTFKRPEGHFAGALIEQAGLKGYKIGGAAVSEKHAGFIVNTGGATAKDVLALVRHIQTTVYAQSGVKLECEMKTLGVL